jgi:PKD repeat protein
MKIKNKILFFQLYSRLFFVVIFYFIFSCITAQTSKIQGPTAVLMNPVQGVRVGYSISALEGYRITWSIQPNLGVSISFVGSTNVIQSNFSIPGRYLLKVQQLSFDGRFILTDSLRISVRNCPAIAGNIGSFSGEQFTPDSLRVCATDATTIPNGIGFDQVIGDSILWQISNSPFGPWNNRIQEQLTPISRFQVNTIRSDSYIRAIISNVGCQDTSRIFFLNIDRSALAVFDNNNQDTTWIPSCLGEPTRNIAALVLNGQGRWSTNGFGRIESIAREQFRYRSNVKDSSISPVTIIWEVVNGACKLRFERKVQIKPTPSARFPKPISQMCPGNTTHPLNVRVFRGTGIWVKTPEVTGSYMNPLDPNTRFRAANEDRGKRIFLTWRMSLDGCDSVYFFPIQITNSSVARIIAPTTTDTFMICPFDTIAIRNDTAFNPGRLLWQSTDNAQYKTDSPSIQVVAKVNPLKIYAYYNDLVTRCATIDSITLVFKPVNTNAGRIKLALCPSDSVIMQYNDLDYARPIVWNPANFIQLKPNQAPVFYPINGDTIHKIQIAGRSKTHGCLLFGNAEFIIKPAILPEIVDMNQRKPSAYCFGYPSFLRIRSGMGCDNLSWFNASRNKLVNSGNFDDKNPNFISRSQTLDLSSLPVDTHSYTFTAICFNPVNGCYALSESALKIVNTPSTEFQAVTSVLPFNNRDVQFTNKTANADNFSWDFGDPASGPLNNSQEINPKHFFSGAGKFVVTLVANNSVCSKSFAQTVEIAGESFYFPNSFTPNNDGLNDIFRPVPAFWDKHTINDTANDIFQTKVLELEILDNANTLIYKIYSNSEWTQQLGWRGQHADGTVVPPGTYLYRILIDQQPLGKVWHTGLITLIR